MRNREKGERCRIEREREREEGERCRKLRRESKSENDTYIYHGF
jgi:hypothetical protein